MPVKKPFIGTLALYGPAPDRANKIAAFALSADGVHIIASRRWFAASGDIRYSPEVKTEIGEFFRDWQVKKVSAAPDVLGCPHEEGIDYPLGGVCGECAYWSLIDRFSGGMREAPAAPPVEKFISAEEIIEALESERAWPPKEALRAAEARREELTPLLLERLGGILDEHAEAALEDVQLFCYGLLLLAKWREQRAFPLVMRWLSLPDEGVYKLTDDFTTEEGSRILAAVCGGDGPVLRAFIENPDVDEICRSIAFDALRILVDRGEMAAEMLHAYFRELVGGRLERKPVNMWVTLAHLAGDLRDPELIELLRQPTQDGLIDPDCISWKHIENGLEGSLSWFQERNTPIDDVAKAVLRWQQGGYEAPEAPPNTVSSKPAAGRNDPCPCGSGKKFKKCCGKMDAN